MTYCLALRLDEGLVFLADTRTNAGVDNVSTYRKLHVLRPAPDRVFVLESAGSLATTQEVLDRIHRDLASQGESLASVDMMIGMWKLAPALACGCTIVMKPAELTSLSALRIGELALEAGLPPGVLNIVTGPGRVVGEALVNHPDVDKVTFTGSPGVGRGILRGAAGNFKRVSLELGGKSANVIFDDADIEAASKAAASVIFFPMPDRSARPAHACWPTRRFMTKWSSG